MTTMDFFGRQDQARKASRRFVILFGLAVLAMILLVYFAVALVVRIDDRHAGWWQPGLLAAVAGLTLTVVASAAIYKIAQLRSGGAFVAAMLGGRFVEPGTGSLAERTLRNVVEEMAIASGVPVPGVYVLDGESSINAFAAGWGQWDAAIAVTRGAIENLDRDELQGVIAHEFSHVFHGDMRLNIRLMGVLFGILCLATIGEIMLRSVGRGAGRYGRRSGKGNPAVALAALGLALLLIGYLGLFFARLIKAAISRQREYLADASAVQYTRNPRGIGMALARIAGKGSRVLHAHAEETSHMFIANGVRSLFGGFWSTHPPIEERIERILPGFRRSLGKQIDFAAAVAGTAPSAPAPAPAMAAGFAPGAVRGATPEAVVATVGNPTEAHVRNAQAILQQIPLELHAAARGPVLAAPLVCALLLDQEPGRRRNQIALLQRADAILAHEASRLWGELQRAPEAARQSLLELAVPALRKLDDAKLLALRGRLRELAECDGVLSPFELMLLKAFERHLPLTTELRSRRRPRAMPLIALRSYAEVVLSALAHAGSRDDPEAAAAAFAEGARALHPVGEGMRLLPRERCGTRELDVAVGKLDEGSPLTKRQLLVACGRAVGTDGEVRADEGVLLRAVAEAWGCPLPPIWSPEGALVA